MGYCTSQYNVCLDYNHHTAHDSEQTLWCENFKSGAEDDRKLKIGSIKRRWCGPVGAAQPQK